MPVFRWGSAYDAFRDLEREMDRWVRSVDLAFEGLRLGRPFPSLNLFDLPESFLMTVELPGCDAGDVDVSVANGTLTLRGSRAADGEIPEDRFRRSERPSGKWERSITLPDRIDEDAIRAELTHGLLRLHLPKLPSTEPRQIRVSDGEAMSDEKSIDHLSMES